MLFTATLLISFLNSAFAECPNACSAHGKCGAYDMCSCYRNWMSNDCSERICQFGLAHVDVPKGDLDASSGALQMTDLGAGTPVSAIISNSDMYPKGASEQFPDMVDSDQATLTNTAHDYAECSSKGLCDRATGTCQCFDGYSGSACQRASCPDTGAGECSGHGTCESIKTIAKWDYANVYKLWDEGATMGCVCDGGYSGADCSERMCKFGADPLYQDSYQTIRYNNWTYSIRTDAAATVTGNYSLVYTDTLGETWQSDPIDIAATCADIISSLESLPNDVFAADTIECHKHTNDQVPGTTSYEPVDTSAYTVHAKYTVAFPSNPGMTASLALKTKLDGARDTLYTDEPTSTLGHFMYSNGFYGENEDFVPDLCEGVTINFAAEGTQSATVGLNTLVAFADAAVEKLFKTCLGDANGDTTDNVDVENWDYGSPTVPHLIKVVDATQESLVAADADPTHAPNAVYEGSLTYICGNGAGVSLNSDNLCVKADPPGFYVALYYHATDGYVILGRPAVDYAVATDFHVYTTTGRLQVVDAAVHAFNAWETSAGTDTGYLLSNTMFTKGSSTRQGLDCETNSGSECLEKGDYAMVFNNGQQYAAATYPLTASIYATNPIYPQIYQVKKVSKEDVPPAEWATYDPATYDWSTNLLTPHFVRHQIVFDKVVNAQYTLDTETATSDTSAMVFKFYPPDNAYEYAGQCSMRGICDYSLGQCECFAGFDGDNCQRIDALASR